MPIKHNDKHVTRTVYDRLFRYAEFLGFGELHMKIDIKTGLRAIIAVHSTKRGPAIGGCRLIEYDSTESALKDALRLAQMMSYKAAACDLSHGGAKAVLMRPKIIKDRQAYFSGFGDFVSQLNGDYITAMDAGTTPEDMDVIQSRTPYVTCTSDSPYGSDPSPCTAHGVLRGIEAAVKFKLGKDTLENVHVAIQGVGNVGYSLAKSLHAQGARLTVTDTNQNATQRCIDEFKAKTVSAEQIYSVDCDVFSPCALGAIINLKTIEQLKAPIVAGSANNQLAHRNHANLLKQRGILYAPDFIVNAGGLIHVAADYDKRDHDESSQQIDNLYDLLLTIFDRSESEQISTHEIAESIAKARL